MKAILFAAASVVALTTCSHFSQAGEFTEPYPYYGEQKAKGYEVYIKPGCADYILEPSTNRIIHICDRRDEGQIHETIRREGAGTAN